MLFLLIIELYLKVTYQINYLISQEARIGSVMIMFLFLKMDIWGLSLKYSGAHVKKNSNR